MQQLARSHSPFQPKRFPILALLEARYRPAGRDRLLGLDTEGGY
jgi:hypothetical protein